MIDGLDFCQVTRRVICLWMYLIFTVTVRYAVQYMKLLIEICFYGCRAITRSDCFHTKGMKAPCHVSNIPYMIIFGIAQLVLSQIPGFGELWFLSIVAAVMSFAYSSIGLGLGIAYSAGKLKSYPTCRFTSELSNVTVVYVTMISILQMFCIRMEIAAV